VEGADGRRPSAMVHVHYCDCGGRGRSGQTYRQIRRNWPFGGGIPEFHLVLIRFPSRQIINVHNTWLLRALVESLPEQYSST